MSSKNLFSLIYGIWALVYIFTLNFLTPSIGNAQVISPSISLTSSQDPAGIKVNISGIGFTKGSTASLYTKNPDGSQSVILYSDTSPDGSFNINHIFPIEYPQGTYLLWAIDNTTGKYSNTVDFIIPLTHSTQTTIPQPSYTPKHGDLIRARGDSNVYFIQGQQQYGQPLGYQRRAIANEHVFNQMGFKWSDVKEIDYQDMIILPEGKPIWSKEIIALFPEGALIRLKGQTQTYVIQGGRKCYIPDPETFQAMGYQWNQVIEVDKATLDSILTGIPIASVKPPYQYTPPGQPPTVQTPPPTGPAVIQPQYPFSPAPSQPYGSQPGTGATPYQTQPQSSSFPDGTLIKGSGPDIYLIQNGVRRLIPDTATFNAMGFNWGNVINVDDQKLGDVPLGIPMPYKKRIR
ncbi:MAG: hypothetical protein AB1502_00515 [Thermodesulfobacteriota bacterium]